MSEYNNELIELPKDWEVKRLSEIAELQRGLSYSGSEKSKDEILDGYLFLTLNSIKEGGGLKEDGWTWIKSDRLKKRHFVKEGDIVIANTDIGMQRGHILGAPAIVHFPEWYKKDKAVFSMDLSKLLLRISNMDVNFLFYYLSFVQPLAKKYHTGTNVWHLNLDSWDKDLLVPIPPLEEQKKIAEILNTVDSIIIDTTNLIEKLKNIKRKTLNLLITGKIWHKEFKDTEIGRIPGEWKIVKLGEIAKISSGNTAPQEEKYFKNGKYPFIRVQHLKELQEEKFPVNYEFVNDYALSELKLKLFKKGCIVFPKSGESIKLEKRAMLKEDSCVVNHLAVIEPLYENIDNLFLFYYLCTIKTSNYLTETTMPSLNLSTISNFLIPLPPLEEQKKIAEILSIIDIEIETEKKYLDYMKKLKEKLLAALMTGKIRVNSIAIGDLR